MSKKIFIFVPSFESGGVERNAVIVANSMLEEGCDVSVVYCRKIDAQFLKLKSKVEKIKLNRISFLPFVHERIIDAVSSILFGFFILRRVVDKKSIIISFQSNVIAIILSKLLNIKVIVRLSNHYSNIEHEQSKLRKISEYLKKVFNKKADVVIANSQELADDYSKVLGCEVKTIYNPIDFKVIQKKSKETVVEELFIKKSKPIVLAIGRLSVQKNFDFLIKSFVKSLKNIDASLVIIGEGSQRYKLEKLIRKLKMEENVFLFGHKNNIFPYLVKSDLFVLSSLYEGMPNVLIEAIASKVPSISTNIKTGPKEILLDGDGGILVKLNDMNEMSEAIEYSLLHQQDSNNKMKNAHIKLDRFSMDETINRYRKIIGELE